MGETAEAEKHETAQGEEHLRVYEVGYHILPSKKEDELESVVAKIREMIEKAGGKFLAEGAPSLQRLAFLISVKENDKRVDHDRGYFGWIKFEAPKEVAGYLEKTLAEMEDILRSIVFKTVREETRARFKTGGIREVRRGDVIRAAPRKEETAAPVSEEDLDKALEELTTE
jgi:ribosomal protein S6